MLIRRSGTGTLSPMQVQSMPARRRFNARWAAGLIALAALAAYLNSFSSPFVFDDLPGILDNATIRHLGTAFSPPANTTANGRPIFNLTLALNYALSGTRVWSYHATNVAIHILASLVLFGIVRRTLARFAPDQAGWAAFAAALIWAVHPLQTESVAYVIQRAESLMGLFYLLTLYFFIRGAEVEKPGAWFAAAFLSCLFGMGTKEVMVSAPVIVFLYDRTFIAGGFRAAWRKRRWLYLALSSTWLALAYLVVSTDSRSGTYGSGIGVTWWGYVLTQFPAILRYLELSVWPHPLVFDYGTEWVGHPWTVAPQAVAVILLAAAALFALWKRPALGFLGVFFFATLAPTSLLPNNRQTMAEHWMYLSLAPVVILEVLAAERIWGARGLIACAALAAALACLTARRNQLYHSGLALWSDTVAKRPDNSYAHDNLGNQLKALDRLPEAIAEYETSLRLKSDYPETQNNIGVVLMQSGRPTEAIAHYETAIRLASGQPEPQCNLADALARGGRPREAIAHYEAAVRLRPDYFDAWLNLGVCLAGAGRVAEAAASEMSALKVRPNSPEAHFNLGNCFSRLGRMEEAILSLKEAVHLKPDYFEARNNLAVELVSAGRLPEAIDQYREVLRLKPDLAGIHLNLGLALTKAGRLPEAIGQFKEALRLDPNYAEAHRDLGIVLTAAGRPDEARPHLQLAAQLKGNPSSFR